MNILAIITARGGSKGIPRKNMVELEGNPLIFYTIDAAKKSKYITDIVVTSDDNEILDYSSSQNVKTSLRPKHLATDTALSSDVVKYTLIEYIKNYSEPDYFILLQPTSPLRTCNHIDKLINDFDENIYHSSVSVCKTIENPFSLFKILNNKLVPLSVEKLGIPRQSFGDIFKSNGAMYHVNTKIFLRDGNFYSEPIQPFIMSQNDSIDIDSQLDLITVSQIMKKRDSHG